MYNSNYTFKNNNNSETLRKISEILYMDELKIIP